MVGMCGFWLTVAQSTRVLIGCERAGAVPPPVALGRWLVWSTLSWVKVVALAAALLVTAWLVRTASGGRTPSVKITRASAWPGELTITRGPRPTRYASARPAASPVCFG